MTFQETLQSVANTYHNATKDEIRKWAMDRKTGEIHRFIARGYRTCHEYGYDIIGSLKAREEQ